MKTDKELLDDLIMKTLTEMQDLDPDSTDYKDRLSALERLTKLRDDNKPKRVSRDTWVMVAGSTVNVLAILVYERVHVLTSKALPFTRTGPNR